MLELRVVAPMATLKWAKLQLRTITLLLSLPN